MSAEDEVNSRQKELVRRMKARMSGEALDKLSPQTMAKSRDPEYDRLTVLVKRETKKAAVRLWEDLQPERDASDLVQLLLEQFLEAYAPSKKEAPAARRSMK